MAKICWQGACKATGTYCEVLPLVRCYNNIDVWLCHEVKYVKYFKNSFQKRKDML